MAAKGKMSDKERFNQVIAEASSENAPSVRRTATVLEGLRYGMNIETVLEKCTKLTKEDMNPAVLEELFGADLSITEVAKCFDTYAAAITNFISKFNLRHLVKADGRKKNAERLKPTQLEPKNDLIEPAETVEKTEEIPNVVQNIQPAVEVCQSKDDSVLNGIIWEDEIKAPQAEAMIVINRTGLVLVGLKDFKYPKVRIGLSEDGKKIAIKADQSGRLIKDNIRYPNRRFVYARWITKSLSSSGVELPAWYPLTHHADELLVGQLAE